MMFLLFTVIMSNVIMFTGFLFFVACQKLRPSLSGVAPCTRNAMPGDTEHETLPRHHSYSGSQLDAHGQGGIGVTDLREYQPS